MINHQFELIGTLSDNNLSKHSLSKNNHLKTIKSLVNKTQNEAFDEIKNHFNKLKTTIGNSNIFSKNMSINVVYDTEIFNSSSSSIIKHPLKTQKYIMNTRFVNYKLNPIGKSDIGDKKCISINKISIIDNRFNELYFRYLFPDITDARYIGIEDIRICNFKNDLYFLGSLYNPLNDKVEIVSNKFILGEAYDPIVIKPDFKTDNNWEKNWVFFNNNEEINIIYKWSPIQICKIDYSNKKLKLTKTIDKLPSIFNEFRGSTNGVFYDNKFWFIVHQQNKIEPNMKSYVHNFVVFDKNMALLGYSNSFKFENKLVEFCIGMELTYENNFVITYSTLDCSSKLIVLSPVYINSLLNYI
jgi:hypothetical protein